MMTEALPVAEYNRLIKGAYDFKEALERQNLRHENVKLLREKVKTSEIVPKFIMDKQLLLFLNAFNDDVSKSAQLVKNFYKIKKSTPQFFSKRDVDSEEVQNCLNCQDYVTLPITPNNCHLIFHRLSNPDAKTYNFDAAAKTFIMLCESSTYRHGPRDGITFVFDLKDVGFLHIFKPCLGSMRKGIQFLEEGMPYQIQAVHVLNAGVIFSYILAIVKPLVRSDMLNKVQLYSSSLDLEKFYKECVPKSHLPSDYGGELESVAELHVKQRQIFKDMKDYFLYEEMQTDLQFDEHVDEYCDDAKC